MSSARPARESEALDRIHGRVPEPHQVPGYVDLSRTDGLFYTNRCGKCGRALTKIEIYERWNVPGGICPCGSNKFHSTNFKWWEELFLIRSWKLWWAIRKGLLPPAPTKQDIVESRKALMRTVLDLDEEANRPSEFE